MVSENKKLNNAKWDRKNTKSFTIKMFIKSDSDLLEFLATINNRNAYIKALIRADLDKLQADPAQAIANNFLVDQSNNDPANNFILPSDCQDFNNGEIVDVDNSCCCKNQKSEKSITL